MAAMTTPLPTLPDGDEVTLDRLIGDWWIHQLKRGHRFSTDDLLCAWQAWKARPDVDRCLDLGCGIGSVGLYLLGMFHRAGNTHVQLTGVEAQEVSQALFRKTVAHNGLSEHVTIHHGDLRDLSMLPEGVTWSLITGSPPYIPLGKGLVSPHPQRAACRMELRGSVFDYCAASAPRLAPGGRFVYVMSARDDRTEAAPPAAGLTVVHRLDVVFRDGDTPMIAVVTCAHADDPDLPPRVDEVMQVRDAEGNHTPDYLAFRQFLGFDS